MEFPARRGASQWPALPPDLCGPDAFSGVDQRFRASLESFHLINARDSALAASETIRIVTAGDVDTPDTMAARMAFLPEPLDQFLILNGLERGAPLVQGQRYKVVAQ